ncbi:MAG: YqgE/AlgH family protein [Verrucomicrobia bacterium]|nr:YqgE/AlgH family protein [Verrucomicrobiota bacterium]
MTSKSQSLKGQFLLDGGKLRGSYFNRTVVLICQHDSEGAFGLVLNRPSDHAVGEMIVADLPDALRNAALFSGGPVQPAALSYLLTDTFIPDANVMSNLTLGHSLDTLVELSEAYSTSQQLRIFAGYAGWSPGQLEAEMKRDAWLIHPGSIDLIFNTAPKELWRTILYQMGWEYRLLADGPDDLSLN